MNLRGEGPFGVGVITKIQLATVAGLLAFT